MATRRWLGRAQAIAQVDTVTVADTWAQNDTVTLTINQKSLVVTIGTLITTAQVATTVKQAWENQDLTDTAASFTPARGGQDIIEHAEITATVSGSVVTLTHDTAGVPFTLTVSETTAGDGTATEATATAATGPNFWDNVDNWSGGAVPVAADDVYIDNSSVSIQYALSQAGATLASLTIAQNFTGDIGLPKRNRSGYVEYRDDYLAIDATSVLIGRGRGSGSSRIKIDSGTVQTAVVVERTGGTAEDGLPAVIWKGTNASNTMEVVNGTVGVARFGGELATLTTLLVTNGDVHCGAGSSLNTVSNEAGNIECFSNLFSLTVSSGTVTVGGDATCATLNLNGGVVFYESSGTITTANVGGPNGAELDCSKDGSSRTITTTNLKPGGLITDPLQTITYTNGVAISSDVRSLSAG
jgi:trimeric autotransporter adhesin